MKLVEEFERFLAVEVNLNNSRIETLTKRIETIQTFLKASGWAAKVVQFSPQGSWAHKTIIKPPGDQGFDAVIPGLKYWNLRLDGFHNAERCRRLHQIVNRDELSYSMTLSARPRSGVQSDGAADDDVVAGRANRRYSVSSGQGDHQVARTETWNE
jgi:hypothetical protein